MEDYKMLLLKQTLIIIVGRSGTGKSSLVRNFNRHNPDYAKTIITTTTRPMRAGEVNGVNYHFVIKQDFERMIAEDKLVEYVEYQGYYYGTTKDEFDYSRTNIVVVEPVGLEHIRNFFKDSFRIFVVKLDAPDAIILERMLRRDQPVEDIVKRYKEDKSRFENIYHDILINTDINQNEELTLFENLVKENSVK
jgi:guanylate kinase